MTEEAKTATENIAAALSDFNEVNIKPFINEGEEYQATIPKLKSISSIITLKVFNALIKLYI